MKYINNFWKNLLFLFLLAGIFLFGVLEYQAVFGYRGMKPTPSDVIIVLGCKIIEDQPTPLLQERLEEGIRLYQSGYGQAIIVSGGQGKTEIMSEAKAMKKYLLSKGIPEKDIYMEDRSHNTYQNMQFSKIIMEKQGFKTAVVTTNTFHLYRAMQLAKDHELQATGSPASMTKEWTVTVYYYLRESLSLLKYYILKIYSSII